MIRISLKIFSCLFLTAMAGAEVVHLQPMAGGEIIGGGCSVNYVRPTSPAEHAGLQAGDFIVRVDSRTIRDFKDLSEAIERAASEAELEFVRAGQTKILKLTLPPLGGKFPRLGLSCAETQSAAYRILVGSFSVTAQASLVQDLTLVRVNITNNSNHTLQAGPKLFSAADGSRLMLKKLNSSDVSSILQTDLGIMQAQEAALNAANKQSSDPFIHSLGSYVFGTVGLKGMDRELAAGLVNAAVTAFAQDSSGVLAPPAITPSIVAREALENNDLDPGYSEEGIIFFTVPKSLPLTLLVNLEGKKSSITFDAAGEATLANKAAPGRGGLTHEHEPSVQNYKVNIPCPFQVLPHGQRVRLDLKDGRSFEGKYMKCDAAISLRSGILYRTFDTDRVDNISSK